jgi:hypothetical protein
MLRNIDLFLCFDLGRRSLVLDLVGRRLKIAIVFEVELSKPNIVALLYLFDVFVDFEELFLEFVVAVIDDILDVVFDYKALSFEYFIEHYFKSIKLLRGASVLIEDTLANLGD